MIKTTVREPEPLFRTPGQHGATTMWAVTLAQPSTSHLSENTWPRPRLFPGHTPRGWSPQGSRKYRVPAQRIFFFPHIRGALDFSPDRPLLATWSVIWQRAPQGWEISPNKVPCDHRGEVVNNLIRLGLSRPSDGCSGHIR